MFSLTKVKKFFKKNHPPKFWRAKLRRVKGSLKDPSFCFRIISIILFGILMIFPSFLLKASFHSPPLINPFLIEISENQTNTLPLLTKKSGIEGPDFLLVQNSGLRSAIPPTLISPQALGVFFGDYQKEDRGKVIVEYIVEPGEALSAIAEKFNLSLNTLLWANNLNQNSKIQPGQKLIVPPVSGVIHYVKAGDTISEIAKKYKGKVEEILAFNELFSERDIYVGDIIIVPNGAMPSLDKRISSPLAPLHAGYFICPIPSFNGKCRLTQGLHWHNAVDFSNGKCGEPIFAAAGGRVLKVKSTNSTSRWAFGGAGNHLTILHPNGVVTMYGHILNSFVSPGEEVSQGQIIALMGGQPGAPGAGKSTGCHLHFGVRGAKNPFVR